MPWPLQKRRGRRKTPPKTLLWASIPLCLLYQSKAEVSVDSSQCDNLSYCVAKCRDEYPEFPESAKVRKSRFVPMVFDREGGFNYDGAYYDNYNTSSLNDYDSSYNNFVEENEEQAMDYPGYVADAATMNNSTYDADSSNNNNVNNRNAIDGSANVAGSRGVKYNNAGPDGANGYALYRTDKLSPENVDVIEQAENQIEGLDFWEVPVAGRELNIAVPKKQIQALEKYAKSNSIAVRQTVPDLTAFIKKSASMKAVKNRMKQSDKYRLNWEDYHGYDLIVEFLQAEAKLQKYITTYSIGQTQEGRKMHVISFAKAGQGKPNIWVEGGIHAREWIAPAVTTYLIRQLAESKDAQKYLDKLNFFILPVTNPDGYEYSRQSTSTRLWRKNRRTVKGSKCMGVDLNRNFGFKFGLVGASKDPCKETYMGTKAFSEFESDNVQKFFKSLNPVPVFALSVHSALNAMLYGRSYDKNAVLPNKNETVTACQAGIDALNRVNNQKFKCMHGPDLYPTGGDASDWYYEQGSRFSYTIELRDNGWSFLLPPKQILPSGKEFWELFKTLMDKVLEDGAKPLSEVLAQMQSSASNKQGNNQGGADYDEEEQEPKDTDMESERVEDVDSDAYYELNDGEDSYYLDGTGEPVAEAVVEQQGNGLFDDDDDDDTHITGELNEDTEEDGEQPLKKQRLYETEELSVDQAANLVELHRHHELKFDFWDMPSVGRKSQIMTSKRDEPMLRSYLKAHGIKAQRVSSDVQRLVDKMYKKRPLFNYQIMNRAATNHDLVDTVDFENYNSYGAMINYLKGLEKSYRGVHVRPIGFTAENRPIMVLSITLAGPGKPNMLMEAGIHAREWISPAVCLHLIRQLVTTPIGRLYQRHFNFHIVPVLNPDGYEFTRRNASTRLWRKNRRESPDSRCRGVDLNRNFDFHFGGVGTDSHKCGQRYHGAHPFSERESQAMRALYLSLHPRPVVALLLHSAIGSWMYGMGHKAKNYPENFDETFSVCHVAVAVLNSVHGQNFSCIHSVDLYPSTGMSQDWYLTQGSRFVYTVELRNNGFGFLLPPEQIKPSGEEMWEAFKYLLNKAIEVGAKPYYPGAPEANAAALGVTKPIYKGQEPYDSLEDFSSEDLKTDSIISVLL